MTRAAKVASLELPGSDGWNFGDYPYGLEPLTLPHPADGGDPSGGPTETELKEAFLRLMASARGGLPTTTAVTRQTLERLYWFRWIIGHHISFIIWRHLAEDVRRLEDADSDSEALAGRILQGIRGYCGMLLYTSSCTRTIYNRTIRPSMYRLHRTFSGTWAPDYRPVRSLFRGRKLPPVVESDAGRLAHEVRLSQEIHLGVASKLVVGGKSLLQRSVEEGTVGQPHMWGSVFDCYFLTVRAPVSAHRITAQLLRRQQAVLIDLATNGLYPEIGGGDWDVPEELRGPAVVDCQNDLTDTQLRIGGLAAGFRLEEVNKLRTA